MPLCFMSSATSSIAPSPAFSIADAKLPKSAKAVPAPHSPSRTMYARFLTDETPVAEQ